MGNYINKLPDGTPLGLADKSALIAALPGVTELRDPPDDFDDVPFDKIMVAVVFNAPWEAALVCDTRREFDYIVDYRRRSGDPRPCRYFLIARATVAAMADHQLESEEL